MYLNPSPYLIIENVWIKILFFIFINFYFEISLNLYGHKYQLSIGQKYYKWSTKYPIVYSTEPTLIIKGNIPMVFRIKTSNKFILAKDILLYKDWINPTDRP